MFAAPRAIRRPKARSSAGTRRSRKWRRCRESDPRLPQLGHRALNSGCPQSGRLFLWQSGNAKKTKFPFPSPTSCCSDVPVFANQRVNEFHRICSYGIAQQYVARPALPGTPLACIDPRITGNHHAIPAIRRCRNRTGTPEYVCQAVPRSNHARRQRSSFRPAAVINSDASRRLLRHARKLISQV
jgi:hypothetical protein